MGVLDSRRDRVRFYTFLASRIVGVLIALDIALRLESAINTALMLGCILFLAWDNWKTLRSMGGVRGVYGGSMGRSDSLHVINNGKDE